MPLFERSIFFVLPSLLSVWSGCGSGKTVSLCHCQHEDRNHSSSEYFSITWSFWFAVTPISQNQLARCARHLHLHFNLLPQLLVLSQVDRVLDEVDWLIARKKSQTASDKLCSGKKPFTLLLSWINGESWAGTREEMHLCQGMVLKLLWCYIPDA